jgi:hypothetical protein
VADRDRDDDVIGGPQTGGTRGSSNQGGPEKSVHRGEEPAKNSAIKVNRPEDRGSRSTTGRDEGQEAMASVEDVEDAEQPGRLTDAPRGPIPAGASRADYVGSDEPHKTEEAGGTPGASGKRNEVI